MTKKPSKIALKILDIATHMFAQKGFDGTIMDALAEHALVNKASIYYHFQDKSNLYEQCITQLFKTVVDEVVNVVDGVDDTKKKLNTFICAFAKQADTYPDMPAILMREFAGGGMSMPVSARQQMQRTLFKLKDILEQGVKEDIFNKVDPFSTHIMIVGSICLFVTSQGMRKAIESEQPTDPELIEAIDSIAKIIIKGLLKG